MKVILTKTQMRLIKSLYPQQIKPAVKGYNFVLSDLFEQVMDEAVKAKTLVKLKGNTIQSLLLE